MRNSITDAWWQIKKLMKKSKKNVRENQRKGRRVWINNHGHGGYVRVYD